MFITVWCFPIVQQHWQAKKTLMCRDNISHIKSAEKTMQFDAQMMRLKPSICLLTKLAMLQIICFDLNFSCLVLRKQILCLSHFKLFSRTVSPRNPTKLHLIFELRTYRNLYSLITNSSSNIIPK